VVIFECVANVSEGRNEALLADLSARAGDALLDLHRDPDHHRAVFTLAGPADLVSESARALATAAVDRLDLRAHDGAHPRLGVLDVVPFVPYRPGGPAVRDLTPALKLRDGFARWLGDALGVPSFLYGPLPDGGARTLPEVRRQAFEELAPDFGPPTADPRTGATAVGARRVLVAYNVWVNPVGVARTVAPLVRRPELRALGLAMGERAQVSCNLVEPDLVGPAQAYDLIGRLVREHGGTVEGAELVGLLPDAVLAAVPAARWPELGLSAGKTVEARLRV
jgi:glutamate formiminotransferase / 5-formyltetrahydrofolate cyclo-ligase